MTMIKDKNKKYSLVFT